MTLNSIGPKPGITLRRVFFGLRGGFYKGSAAGSNSTTGPATQRHEERPLRSYALLKEASESLQQGLGFRTRTLRSKCLAAYKFGIPVSRVRGGGGGVSLFFVEIVCRHLLFASFASQLRGDMFLHDSRFLQLHEMFNVSI